MAQQYVLSTDSFATITETSGTIQNVGIEAVELVSGTNAVAGEGITLHPGERITFDGAISARRLGDNDAVINVVDFSLAGKGGVNHVYIPKGSVAFANLPTTLTADMLGWTYNVSDAFTTDSQFVEGAGVSYPAGQNVVVVEASTGVYKYDCFGGAYILPIATDKVLGGVKSSSVDGDVTVNNDGTMSQNLLGYRKPSTAYTAGQIAYHASLPTGYYLECTTAGTTGSGALTISGTITPNVTAVTDGTVTWLVRSVKSAVQFNTKQTFTSSGTFTAPVTGVYKITLQGGGGGGSSGGTRNGSHATGSGGGSGAKIVFYEKLTAGTSYDYIIGAGGAGGTNATPSTSTGSGGGIGGGSYTTINGTFYIAEGGMGAASITDYLAPGRGGRGRINNNYVSQGFSGSTGYLVDLNNGTYYGAIGGGEGAGRVFHEPGVYGGGGAGGCYEHIDGSVRVNGSAGGDGYITFEYCSN